jgi:hypothetical protein
VIDTFVCAVEKTKKDDSGLNLLQILTADDYDCDHSGDESDEDDYEKPMTMNKLMITIHSHRRNLDATNGLSCPRGDFNVYGNSRCRFAADAASGNNRFHY